MSVLSYPFFRLFSSDCVRPSNPSNGWSASWRWASQVWSEARYFVSTAEELERLFTTPIQANLTNARVQHCWTATCVAESRETTEALQPPSCWMRICCPQPSSRVFVKSFGAGIRWSSCRTFISHPDQSPTCFDQAVLGSCGPLASPQHLDTATLCEEAMLCCGRHLWVGVDPDDRPASPWWELSPWRVWLVRPRWNLQSATSDTTRHVMAPYDGLQKYLCRAESFCLKVPDGIRLGRLEALDRAERGEWAHRFANSNDKLGAIIMQAYQDRDSHWLPSAVGAVPAPARPAEPRDPPSQREKPAAREFAAALRDGQGLRKDFQIGKCQRQREGRCPNCAVVFPSRCVCGSPRHIGSMCPDQRKSK